MALNKSRSSGRNESPDNDTAGVQAPAAATRGVQETDGDHTPSMAPTLAAGPVVVGAPSSQKSLGDDTFARESPDAPTFARESPDAPTFARETAIGPIPGTIPPIVPIPGTSMLNPAALTAAAPVASGGEEDAPLVDLEPFSLAQLLEIRLDIDARLPPHTLQEMDLEEELLLQYQLAKDLMTRVLAGFAQPNHKAQTVNTCATILAAVTKSQAELHNSETVKAIELALERVFKDRPQEEKLVFFEQYAAALREISTAVKKRKPIK